MSNYPWLTRPAARQPAAEPSIPRTGAPAEPKPTTSKVESVHPTTSSDEDDEIQFLYSRQVIPEKRTYDVASSGNPTVAPSVIPANKRQKLTWPEARKRFANLHHETLLLSRRTFAFMHPEVKKQLSNSLSACAIAYDSATIQSESSPTNVKLLKLYLDKEAEYHAAKNRHMWHSTVENKLKQDKRLQNAVGQLKEVIRKSNMLAPQMYYCATRLNSTFFDIAREEYDTGKNRIDQTLELVKTAINQKLKGLLEHEEAAKTFEQNTKELWRKEVLKQRMICRHITCLMTTDYSFYEAAYKNGLDVHHGALASLVDIEAGIGRF